ncbi:MAG: hypothetical protein ACRETP_11075, partial [Steroidobacteraceae bacterium]
STSQVKARPVWWPTSRAANSTGADHVWLISFMHYDLGFFDDQCNRVECAPNPFTADMERPVK